MSDPDEQDAITALIEQWRKEAAQPDDGNRAIEAYNVAVRVCADELEALQADHVAAISSQATQESPQLVEGYDPLEHAGPSYWLMNRATGELAERVVVLSDVGRVIEHHLMPEQAHRVLIDIERLQSPASPAPPQEWRSMESAPKDGTWFLGYEPEESPKVMRWDTDTHDKNPAWRDHELDQHAPTHFTPLPPPPQTPSPRTVQEPTT